MSSRARIAQQVQRLLNGGNPSSPVWAKEGELYIAISQVLNKLLKVDHLSVNMANGETIPSGSALVTYDNISVSTYKNVAKCTLPAIPIALPLDIGLYYIGPSTQSSSSNIINSQFIPVEPGQGFMMQNQPMISTMLGQVWYERHGKDVIFGTDITAAPNNITNVLVKMFVMDMSQYGDYDLLPIPADMEADAVAAVYALFSKEKSPDKIDNPVSNETMTK